VWRRLIGYLAVSTHWDPDRLLGMSWTDLVWWCETVSAALKGGK
jgi:hypothetical protein